MNFDRVLAIILRNYFLTIHQLERFTDLLLFPIVGLLLWGFFAQYVGIESALASFLVGGLIFWTIFERVGSGIGIDFMWDIWEHNLMNVLASPITLIEHIGGLVIVAILKVLVSLAAMLILAGFVYGFNLATLGSSLALLWINVVLFAVVLGIFNVAVVLRFGHIVGPLTWVLPFAIQPFSAAFYPVSVLPQVIQKIVWFLPLSHVFEGMRYTFKTGKLDANNLLVALILNLIYFALAVAFFIYMFHLTRKKGSIVKL